MYDRLCRNSSRHYRRKRGIVPKKLIVWNFFVMSFPLIVDSLTLSTAAIQAQTNGGDLRQAGICLVDLRTQEAYDAGHIPGAVRGTASLLNRSAPPCGGLLPEPDAVNTFLSEVGANMGDQIVAYDGGRETAAARMIWVLDAYGYEATSWLDGGFNGWVSQLSLIHI